MQQQQTKKNGFNIALCDVDDFQFIICKNLEGVVNLLVNKGYDLQKMKTVQDVYNATMDFIKKGGDDAQDMLMLVHPHKAYILQAEQQRNLKKQESNMTGRIKRPLSEYTEDELKSLKQQIEEMMKKPEYDKQALQAQMNEVMAELKKRLNEQLGGGKTPTDKKDAGFTFTLKKEHIFILIIVLVLFVIIKK